MNSKVNLFVVGAAKAGTTWLYNQFLLHPEVAVPNIKELNYFTRFTNNPSYYSKYFEEKEQHKYFVDVSPLYFHHEHVAAKIFEYNPQAKIIIILREPLERAYSHYYMRWLDRRATGDIDQEFQTDDRYIGQGLYHRNIRTYLNAFPVEQVHVCYFDDLKKDGNEFLKNIYTFLELDSVVNERKIQEQINYRYGKSRSKSIHSVFKFVNTKIFGGPSVIKKMLRPFARKILFKSKSQLKMPNLDPAYEKEIAKIFLDELDKLSEHNDHPHIESYKTKLKAKIA